jgi:hypothetical protein
MGEIFEIPEKTPLPDEWANKTNGIIFKFKDMEQAKAFATEVWQQYKLPGRVFDNAEDAERAHMFPWVQEPPVAHIDRPWWRIPDWLPKTMHDRIWKIAWKIEPKIEKLAEQFGGKFVGT